MDGDARLHGSFEVEWCNLDVNKWELRGFQVVTYMSKKICSFNYKNIFPFQGVHIWCICQQNKTMNVCVSSMLPFIPTSKENEYIRNELYKVKNTKRRIRRNK